MKKIFSILITSCLALAIHAQSTDKQVATLQYGDQTRVFYGIDALKQAYDAAPDTLGVITLSSGEFNVPRPISKSITIYGAGFENDTVTGTKQTYLNGYIQLKPADSQDEDGNTIKAGKRVNGVHIEGVHINGNISAESNNNEPIHKLNITKSKCSGITFVVDCYNCVIKQSVITGDLYSNTNTAYNLLISNCHFIGGYYGSQNNLKFSSTSTILIDHCILGKFWSNATFRYTNNIFTNYYISTGSVGANNIFISSSGTSTTTSTDGNWYDMRAQGVWADETEDGTYAEGKDFALKYPKRYIGTDGTEIGLHGGIYAWNKIPSTPRITECIIDTKDAANGTLKLSIKAEAQTKE